MVLLSGYHHARGNLEICDFAASGLEANLCCGLQWPWYHLKTLLLSKRLHCPQWLTHDDFLLVC